MSGVAHRGMETARAAWGLLRLNPQPEPRGSTICISEPPSHNRTATDSKQRKGNSTAWYTPSWVAGCAGKRRDYDALKLPHKTSYPAGHSSSRQKYPHCGKCTRCGNEEAILVWLSCELSRQKPALQRPR